MFFLHLLVAKNLMLGSHEFILRGLDKFKIDFGGKMKIGIWGHKTGSSISR